MKKNFSQPQNNSINVKKENKFRTKIMTPQFSVKKSPKKVEFANDDNIFTTQYDEKLKGWGVT